MKMVAAAKLRRAQDAVVSARPYAAHLRTLADEVARRTDAKAHPLLAPGHGDVVTVIVITSDRGLCGGFNSNLVNETMNLLGSRFEGAPVELTVIGRKGIDLLRRRPCTILNTHPGVQEQGPMRVAETAIGDATARFLTGQTREVYCLFNAFESAIAQTVTLEKLLPFEPGEASGGTTGFEFEPGEAVVLESLLQHHLTIQMHRMLFESAASEYGARMTAMDAATNNAGDMIEQLTLRYNRVRQDAITREMIEIVGGAEAL
jgi:F-type H+-transporting ATPase subunit gamma